MNEQEYFETLVILLARLSNECDLEINNEIIKFEDAIKNSNCGDAYFGIAKSDWDRIEIIDKRQMPYKYKNDGLKFYAEYYDGCQAPFCVCKWNADFTKLENILKNTTNIVYKKYIEEKEHLS